MEAAGAWGGEQRTGGRRMGDSGDRTGLSAGALEVYEQLLNSRPPSPTSDPI